jgi:antirestriction protein ArdC
MENRQRELADKIIASLEKGCIPWRSVYGGGHKEGGYTKLNVTPASVVSLKKYNGRNWFSTRMSVGLNQYSSGWFASFKQWKENNCMVKKGEHSTPIVFWSEEDKVMPDGTIEEIMVRRWSYVFNIDQVEPLNEEGEKFLLVSREVITSPVSYEKVPTTYVDIEGEPYYNIAYFDRLPSLIGCKFEIQTKVEQAEYDPENDTIIMPPMHKFDSSDAYYSTLLHEAVHATCRHERCGRYDDPTILTNSQKAREELVAEMATVILADKYCLIPVSIDNSASYINHWIKELKAEPKFINEVLDDASKAVSFLSKKLEA